MRKMIFMFVAILMISTNLFAQKTEKNKNELTYSCDEIVKQNTGKETITLVGNANLKTDVFEFLNAKKIVINHKTNIIVVMGEFRVNLNDGTIQKLPELTKNHLRYKIGKKTAYLE